ncbi:acid phosphatase phoa, partial [Aureobasidium melanogenum]
MMKTAGLLLAVCQMAYGAPTTSYASPPPVSTIEPSASQISAAAASATPLSPTSNVKGLAFSRFYQIWLENIDFATAAGDPNQAWLAEQGITLSNYWATTHPSEPNYCAAAGGDNFGMDSDDFHSIPEDVKTVVDLLETKGITWAEYQEHIPYAGFQGYNYSNQKTFHDDYVRKHNPLILYQSVTNNDTRLKLIKSFDDFDNDFKNHKLPQWAFITPNMTNDAHDTNITFGGRWERNWLEPLLKDDYFMNDTLVLLTFDENETYGVQNKIFSVLIGGAVPKELRGTTDATFYNHYSTIASVSQNWGLPSLGRWDCSANVFELVANKTGYKNAAVDLNDEAIFYNASYPGPLSTKKYIPTWPVPTNSSKCANGKGVLKSVVDTIKGQAPTYNYSSPYPYDPASGVDVPHNTTKAPPGKRAGLVDFFRAFFE